jgi:nitrite reductase/ring-hydroxylating ferredoxin subunit
MPRIRVASLSDLQPGALMQVEAGGTALAVCNHDGTLHAFQGQCPHRSGPLGQGNLADGNIVCPWHAWEFRVQSGENDYNPDIVLKRYAIAVEGDSVFVEL